MRSFVATLVLIFGALAPLPTATSSARGDSTIVPHAGAAIPGSIQAEHHEIHAALEAATKRPGGIGQAAQVLATVLHPHFVREEQIALPPLGFLAPLARGEQPQGAAATLEMTDLLKREMPQMLDEHVRIRAAVQALREAARAQQDHETEHFTEALAAHALMEEEVLYPAAILVGDVLRARASR